MTSLKAVAGTTDANDLKTIEQTEDRLILANNRQILINSKTQDKINQLTSIINKIVKISKDRLITEIGNLMLTLTLDKLNILNPEIINHTDLKSILTDQIAGTTIIDVLEVSNIEIDSKSNIISLIKEFFRVSSISEKITIYPVAHKGSMLQLHGTWWPYATSKYLQ